MENENITLSPDITHLSLDVMIGKTWYKLVGASLTTGLLVGVVMFLGGRKMFEAGFEQTTITAHV